MVLAILTVVAGSVGQATTVISSITRSATTAPPWVIALVVAAAPAGVWFSYRRYRDAVAVHRELATLSLLDGLTGLPNRLYLNSWLASSLQEAERVNGHVGVMFIDLDRFKVVNDTHGHEVGDRLMVAVAKRLRASLRPEDHVVRYGGDEFVTICHDLPHKAAAERLASRIIEELERPFEINGDLIRISCSIGIAVTESRERDIEDVLRTADAAMYRAKGTGSGTYQVIDRQTRDTAARTSTEARLRQALEREEFELFYQPVVELPTKRIVGAEALLRWRTPDRGLVSPGEFLPLLEQLPLMNDVGRWVLQAACREASTWPSSVKVNVNLAPRQLAQADLAESVVTALRHADLAPSRLCLELTESALLGDVESAWSALRALEEIGVRVALDDFGTGVSTLSHLRHLQLDVLKIDRSFVNGIGTSHEDTVIIEHLVSMATALGIDVVAEGIEEPSQLAELERMGCGYVQGFLLAKPMSAPELRGLLAPRPRPAPVQTPPEPVSRPTPRPVGLESGEPVEQTPAPVLPRLRAWSPG